MPEETEEKTDPNIVTATNPETNNTETWFSPSADPWYTLLTATTFEEIRDAMEQLDLIFASPCK